MSRELGDERARYTRRSLRDRAVEVIDWVRAHPVASAAIALFIAVAAIQFVAPGRSARVADLRVGDCLYIRTPSSIDVGPGARPIGDPITVEAVLMGGGAEQASCTASHGHEVSALVELNVTPPIPSGVPIQPSARHDADVACEAGFAGYVGHPLSGSAYETFAAVPSEEAIGAGQHVGVCLIARRDGQWMNHPARGSGE